MRYEEAKHWPGNADRGQVPPTPVTHGLLGDVFRLESPLLEGLWQWVCTKTGAGSRAEWKELR